MVNLTKKWMPFLLISILAILFAFMALTFRNGHFEFNWLIIRLIRLPEVIILIMGTLASVIATFAVHLLTKNKIADIGIIGMTGINLFLLTLIYSLVSVDLFIKIRVYILPIIYVVGSLVILLIIFGLTFKFRQSADKIILIGIVFTLTISSITQMILSNMSSNKQMYLQQFAVGFLAVGVNILTQPSSIIAYSLIGVSLLLFIIFSKKMVIVYSDPEKARSIGISIKFIRIIWFVIIAFASAASFILLGSIAFIGFIATNIIYLFHKRVGIIQLLWSLITGITLMLGVYVIKHTIIPAEIPLGIATNIIAIPYLVFVLWKGDRYDR